MFDTASYDVDTRLPGPDHVTRPANNTKRVKGPLETNPDTHCKGQRHRNKGDPEPLGLFLLESAILSRNTVRCCVMSDVTCHKARILTSPFAACFKLCKFSFVESQNAGVYGCLCLCVRACVCA